MAPSVMVSAFTTTIGGGPAANGGFLAFQPLGAFRGSTAHHEAGHGPDEFAGGTRISALKRDARKEPAHGFKIETLYL